MPINLNAYSDALVVLGTAGIVIPVMHRLGVNQILGYMAAGIALGPLGLGSCIESFPALYWFTVVDANNVAGIAEFGIVCLLFRIGLQLSFARLTTMRRLVFGLGSLQIVVTATLISGFLAMAGQTHAVAVILGTSLALSSTAIVLELLSSQARLTTSAGRAGFSILLCQDLAVIPILLFVSIAGGGSDAMLVAGLVEALVQAVVALALIFGLGRALLRPLFRLVASTGSSELFLAAVLFVIVAAGLVANQAGLSMPLGAFVAGLLLAETEFGKAIEAKIEPFKALLLGIFFFSVGMNTDLRLIAREPLLLVAAVVGLVAVKALVLYALARTFRLTWTAALETALLLGPGGEFAFVTISAAAAAGLVGTELSRLVLVVTAISMALTPLLSLAARRITSRSLAAKAVDPELSVHPAGGTNHAIVVGYGRVGKVVCSLLRSHAVPYVATDHDAATVARDRRAGHAVYYGDAEDLEFLCNCGLMQAACIVITIHSHDTIDNIVRSVRARRPDILIVARARDGDHARHLYAIGATDAVPETIEASLQLSEAALTAFGVPAGPAVASIHAKREEFRRALQDAARGGPPATGHARVPEAGTARR